MHYLKKIAKLYECWGHHQETPCLFVVEKQVSHLFHC